MAKPKYDYKGEEFLSNIETLAKKGLTDSEIAFSIGLSVSEFSRKKEKIAQISQALTRGRNTINQTVRQTYLSLALGRVKVKSTTRRVIEAENEDGEKEIVAKELIQETETEIAPNPQALATWLFNHDEEWRRLTIEGKKLDITTNLKGSVSIDNWLQDKAK